MKRLLSLAALALLAVTCSSCKSYRIDARVENRTGQAINLLEVDYPSASFGADTLAAGATMPYRFQVRGSGKVSVQYTESTTQTQRKIDGPSLEEKQEGSLVIILQPDGKADFEPTLSGR